MDIRIFILAGGQGKRLWPISSKNRAKQFCKFNSNKTLLEETLDRYKELGPCTIIGNILDEQRLRTIDKVELILEKKRLDTAPCLKVVLDTLKDHQAALIVPSDHYMQNCDPLLSAIKNARLDDVNLHLFGLQALIPYTNLGYLKINAHNKIKAFYEKPTKNHAKQLIQEGYLHNSGLILTSKKALRHNLESYAPHLLQQIEKKECFNKALLEHSKNLLAHSVAAPFLDLGTYRALHEYLKHKNITDGHNHNTLIHATSREVKAFGMKDTIICESDDGVLVFHKDYLEKIDQLLK
jgi:mannose-1-phosphate guanylyltransferase